MTNKPLVVFRADGHSSMGLGHLIRSSALAEMLSPTFHCVLVYRDCPPSLLPTLREGFSDFKVATSEPGSKVDAVELVSFAKSLALELQHGYVEVQKKWDPIIVLDGYHFKTDYQRVIKDAGFKLVCIDDIHACPFRADVIINHAPNADKKVYEAKPNTIYCLGLDYVLLRSPFRAAALSLPRGSESMNQVFICLGGADPQNHSLAVLREAALKRTDATFQLVLGSAYLGSEALNEFLQENPDLNVHIHRNLSAHEMVTLMQVCGQAITSPSTICLEYLSVGGVLHLFLIADNQKDIEKALYELQLAKPFSDFGLTLTTQLTSTAARVFDGKQGDRVRSIFRGLQAKVRRASLNDCKLYYEWVNDSMVRSSSYNSEPVPYPAHEQWFKKRLIHADSFLYVVEVAAQPIGQVRLEATVDSVVVNFSLAAEHRGKGLGLALLSSVLSEHRKKDSRRIIAFVKKSNQASAQLFRYLSFKEEEASEYPVSYRFVLD